MNHLLSLLFCTTLLSFVILLSVISVGFGLNTRTGDIKVAEFIIVGIFHPEVVQQQEEGMQIDIFGIHHFSDSLFGGIVKDRDVSSEEETTIGWQGMFKLV